MEGIICYHSSKRSTDTSTTLFGVSLRILGVGLVLSFRTHFIQLRKFGYALKNTIGRALHKTKAADGATTPFQSLCTALAATVGTGNIAGVAGAIAIGGPERSSGCGSLHCLACAPNFPKSPLCSSFQRKKQRRRLGRRTDVLHQKRPF